MGQGLGARTFVFCFLAIFRSLLTFGQPFIGAFVKENFTNHIPNDLPPLVKPPHWLAAYLPENRSYAGLENDLPALLKDRQTEDGWVMMFDYSLGQRDFFLNVSHPPCHAQVTKSDKVSMHAAPGHCSRALLSPLCC